MSSQITVVQPACISSIFEYVITCPLVVEEPLRSRVAGVEPQAFLPSFLSRPVLWGTFDLNEYFGFRYIERYLQSPQYFILECLDIFSLFYIRTPRVSFHTAILVLRFVCKSSFCVPRFWFHTSFRSSNRHWATWPKISVYTRQKMYPMGLLHSTSTTYFESVAWALWFGSRFSWVSDFYFISALEYPLA